MLHCEAHVSICVFVHVCSMQECEQMRLRVTSVLVTSRMRDPLEVTG